MAGSKDFEEAMKQFKKGKNPMGGMGSKAIVGIMIVLLGLWGGFSCYYTVEPEEEAVILRFGKFLGTYPPGLHFKFPFGIDRMLIVKSQTVHQEEFGFRTNRIRGSRTSYSTKNYDHESLMLTGDLNVADVEWVVQYKISNPYKYLFQAANPRQNIRDVSESIMRRVVGDRTVNEVLTTGRAAIATEAKVLIQEVLDKYDIGINVVTIKLQDVNPPDIVKPSFNEVNEARQEQEKLINEAERGYNSIIPEAKGKADEQISRAEGYANALVERAKGDASKFQSVWKAYKKAPSITKKKMYIEAMEKFFQKFDDITIVDKKVKGLLPVYQGQTKVGK